MGLETACHRGINDAKGGVYLAGDNGLTCPLHGTLPVHRRAFSCIESAEGGPTRGGLVDIRVLKKRRKKTKNSLKIVMFDSQVSLVNRSQGLEKKKKEHKNLGLVAAHIQS